MLYLIKKNYIGLNCLKKYNISDNSYSYEVINRPPKYLTAGEIYNSDNYVYCDVRNMLFHKGYTVIEEYDLLNYKPFKDAVSNYKLKQRQSKLNKI